MRIGLYLGRHGTRGGMLVYAQDFVRALVETESGRGGEGDEYILYGDSSVLSEEFLAEITSGPVLVAQGRSLLGLGASGHFKPLPNGKRCRFLTRVLPGIFGRLGGYLLDQVLLPLLLRIDRVQLVHSLTNCALLSKRLTQVVTVHDLYQAYPLSDMSSAAGVKPPRKSLWVKLRELYYQTLFARQFRSVDRVIADSAPVAKEIADRYKLERNSIVVVPLGLDDQFQRYLRNRQQSAADAKEWRSSIGLRQPYVIMFASLDPRKNLMRTVRAFKAAVKAADVAPQCAVIVSDARAREVCLRELDEELKSGSAIVIADASREELARILDGAAVTLVPTLGEGFGLPAFESLSFGIPVVSSPLDFFRDFPENLRFPCNPFDEKSIVSALGLALSRSISIAVERSSAAAGGKSRSVRTIADAAADTVAIYRATLLERSFI